MNKRLTTGFTFFVFVLFSQFASAVPVHVFYDSGYVDTSREASNINNQLGALGHTTTTFTGTSDVEWTSVLSSTQAIVIPEQENGSLVSALSASVETQISTWVSSGGNFVVSGSHTGYGIDLLNSIFGWSLTGTTHDWDDSSITAEAAATAFAGGPATLEGLNATWHITGGMPSDAISIYTDSTGTSVMDIVIDQGHVTFLAYDWFATDANDGWGDVLNTAVSQDASAVPEPATLLIMGISLIGVGFTQKKKLL